MALMTPVGTPSTIAISVESTASSTVTGMSGLITCQAGKS